MPALGLLASDAPSPQPAVQGESPQTLGVRVTRLRRLVYGLGLLDASGSHHDSSVGFVPASSCLVRLAIGDQRLLLPAATLASGVLLIRRHGGPLVADGSPSGLLTHDRSASLPLFHR